MAQYKNYLIPVLIGMVIIETTIIIWGVVYITIGPEDLAKLWPTSSGQASAARAVTSPYYYNFKSAGILPETGAMDESSSPYWWVNSGGSLTIEDGIGKTVQGELSKFSPWRIAYAKANPLDTDNGYHPQNIFRLISRSMWENVQQEAYFNIANDNVSDSPNRNESNGLLLMSRYLDGNNLYYAGVRIDGAAVIKKKYAGDYTTLAYKKIFEGTYDKIQNPNLLPQHTWIGLRSEVITNADSTVTIKLFTDIGKTGIWTLVLEAHDDNTHGQVIHSEGYTGIRTDFMDVLFDDYKNTAIS